MLAVVLPIAVADPVAPAALKRPSAYVSPTRYTRQSHTPTTHFFASHWYAPFVLLLLVSIILMVLLWCTIHVYFHEREQKTRREEWQRMPGTSQEGTEVPLFTVSFLNGESSGSLDYSM
ncbi:hypothetical protein DQ04_16031010 [Trypanosoma grayi]|uniref:hypothetical protein n=1 Tax=Trypanosoma grayi TaxID=71804 RepID=UPI0004F4B665|nr:hypothetical protein DQ04_16031010 [Trypanosoma grayi]KEG06084.1 hypothetical protein DQ04_16031010 [Trypanosoma grayi]